MLNYLEIEDNLFNLNSEIRVLTYKYEDLLNTWQLDTFYLPEEVYTRLENLLKLKHAYLNRLGTYNPFNLEDHPRNPVWQGPKGQIRLKPRAELEYDGG